MSRFIFILLFVSTIANAQVHYLPEDTVIFNRFLQYSRSRDAKHCVSTTALYFINTPYIAGTLEGDSDERLRVNLRELDCVTFVETVIALHLMLQSDNQTFDNYCRILQNIRYRNGIINGYLSRLHYFSEWLENNRQKEIISLPVIPPACSSFTPNVSFMSNNCNSYPALKDNANLCKQMSEFEKNVNLLNFCYTPKEQVKGLGTNIKTGDIIAITTRIKGLDIVHTGFAYIQNGKTHLLHASSDAKKVLISDETLHEYLARYKNHTGIIQARIID